MAQRLMGPFVVVRMAEAREVRLRLGERCQVVLGKDLAGDRAVEALDLALGLGMDGPAMPRLDSQPGQPRFEAGEAAHPGRAPGAAVVAEDGLGQAVLAEDRCQQGLHGGQLLVVAGTERQREAGVVIEQAPGMDAPGARSQRTMPHEIHLPHDVRLRVCEAQVVPGWRYGGQVSVPAQDASDGARCRDLRTPFRHQPMVHLAPAPRRVLPSQLKHLLLHRRRGLAGRTLRAARAVGQNLKRLLAATGWGRRHAPCGRLVTLPRRLLLPIATNC